MSETGKLPKGRHPLSDDWFREKSAAFRFDDISAMTDDERQRSKEREQTNKLRSSATAVKRKDE